MNAALGWAKIHDFIYLVLNTHGVYLQTRANAHVQTHIHFLSLSLLYMRICLNKHTHTHTELIELGQ